MADITNTLVEELLLAPYWVIDVLPYRVPANSGGQYFAVEEYLLEQPQIDDIRKKMAEVILKLNCYTDLQVSRGPRDDWATNPKPDQLAGWIRECVPSNEMAADHINFVIQSEYALITLNRDDTYLTVYGASPELRELLAALATSAGLFMWKAS